MDRKLSEFQSEPPTILAPQLGSEGRKEQVAVGTSARWEALERKVKFLEQRLEQRYEETVNAYQDRRKWFDKQQDYVFSMFLDLPPDTGLTRTEIVEQFRVKYPHLASVDAIRRAYELERAGKLWKQQEKDAVRFYLKLQPETSDSAETVNVLCHHGGVL